MSPQTATIIDQWAREAIQRAHFEEMSDGRWFGEVPGCTGAAATAESRRDVERELFSVLEEWALLGMQLGDDIPVYGDIDLNTEEARNLAGYHA